MRARAACVGLLILAFTIERAGAQSCGDIDADGSVTVGDGVTVLRAAASLQTNCTPALCDADANGTIEVADGVKVLRVAADLPEILECAASTITSVVGSVTDQNGSPGVLEVGRAPIPTSDVATITNVAGDTTVVAGGTNVLTLSVASADATQSAALTADPALIVAVKTTSGQFLENFFTLPVPSAGGDISVTVSLSATLPDDAFELAFATSVGGTISAYTTFGQQPLCNAASGTPLAPGSTICSALLSPSEIDVFPFAGNAGDMVVIRMVSTIGGIRTCLELRDSTGATVARDCGNSFTSRIDTTLPSSGTFTIVATDFFGSETGAYGLGLQRTNNPGQAVAINYGTTVQGSLPAAAQLNALTFNGSADDPIVVRLAAGAGGIRTCVQLFGPSGEFVTESCGNSFTSRIDTRLRSSGQFTLLVTDFFGSDTGEYGLNLQRTRNPGAATPIGFGQTINSSLLAITETDAFTFTAGVGDAVLIRLVAGAGGVRTCLELFDGNGNPVTADCGNAFTSMIDTTLGFSGTATIIVSDFFTTDTGEYSLTLQRTNVP